MLSFAFQAKPTAFCAEFYGENRQTQIRPEKMILFVDVSDVLWPHCLGIELIPFGYKNYKNQVNFYYRLLLIHQSCKIAII